MTAEPTIVLHQLPPSHPCHTVRRALELKGLEFETVDVTFGRHNDEVAAIYGEGATTVPGILVDGAPVHGTIASLRAIDALRPDVAPLYPADRGEAQREAEVWADGVFQDLGRRLPWSALHFRPELIGTLLGQGPLDGAGTDYGMKVVRAGWRYHGITAARLEEDLRGLPDVLARVDGFVAEGLMGGEAPTALDLHVGATIRVLASVGDLRPVLERMVAWPSAQRLFPARPASIPVGTYPAGWAPA